MTMILFAFFAQRGENSQQQNTNSNKIYHNGEVIPLHAAILLTIWLAQSAFAIHLLVEHM
jgi:hypothetical protein